MSSFEVRVLFLRLTKYFSKYFFAVVVMELSNCLGEKPILSLVSAVKAISSLLRHVECIFCENALLICEIVIYKFSAINILILI